MSAIDCFIIYSEKEIEYVEFLKKSAEKFKSNQNKLNWYCIQSCKKTKTVPKGFTCLDKVPDWENKGHASMNHSLGLNRAQKYVKNDKAIFIDSDVAILYPNWDDVVMQYLEDYACFGFEFGDDSPRYHGFPGVFFFAFNSKILNKVELNFKPKLKKGSDSPARITLNDPIQAKYMGKKVGKSVKCDTAWRIPVILKSAGYNGYGLKRVLGNNPNHLLPFKDKAQKKFCLQKEEHMAEWHYNNLLFGTHKQAGRSHSLTKSKWGRIWRERINIYTKKRYNVVL